MWKDHRGYQRTWFDIGKAGWKGGEVQDLYAVFSFCNVDFRRWLGLVIDDVGIRR